MAGQEMKDGQVRDGCVKAWLGEQKRAERRGRQRGAGGRSARSCGCPNLVYHDPDL